MLDSNDDIVMVYYDLEQLETHFARFGLDGTLKHDQMYPSNVMPMIGGWVRVSGLTQYSTDPIGYNYFGVVASDHWGQGYNWGYELDSMFNITNTFFLQETNPPGYPYHTFSGMHDCMTSLGDGTACFARNVRRKPEIWTLGLEKVDTTGQVLKEVWFKPIPRRHGGGSCIGLQRDYKGYICYSYVSLSMDSVNYIACIKLDENLNIIWERYNMKDIDEFLRDTNSGMRVLDNGAMMVFGNTNYLHWNWNNMAAPWLEPFLSGMYMIIWDEIPVGIPETETNIRPYLMYPIPVNDQLHIHYSPDITPSSIVIYDIQGRLVRTVNNDFESLSMEGLASGQYVMKVTMEDGKVFTDKVIKE